MLALGQYLEDELHTGSVLRHRRLELELLAIGLVFDEGIRQPDFFDAAAGDDRLVGHVVECIFYTAASAVENKDFHFLFL